MTARRTYVYFTAEQRRRLDEIAKREGRSLAEVVRDAVDAYVSATPADVERILDESFGACPDIEAPSRSGWSSREARLGI